MPRTARASVGGVCYHVMNRGNGRMRVFHKDGDYEAFLRLIEQACERIAMRVVGVCLMPNHFHLVLWPFKDGDLSRWMQWLLTAHVRRYHAHRQSQGGGHVWQGRFTAFPIEHDEHMLAVLSYVEANARRAGLVKHAQDWRWGSLALRHLSARSRPAWLVPGPVALPRNWTAWVNRPLPKTQQQALQTSFQRGRPFGSDTWTTTTAARLHLQHTLNPRGRPRKKPKK